MRHIPIKRLLTAAFILCFASGEAIAHGFRGGMGGGFRGGMGGAGVTGMRGGFGGMGAGAAGARGGNMAGGFGGASMGRASSFSAPGGAERSGGAFRGYNPYVGRTGARGGTAERGPYGGGTASGFRSGSYTTNRGGTIDYGAAGRGAVGPGGAAVGGAIGGARATTAGGRTFTDVGRAGGAVGPGGNAIDGRENLAGVSGPRGTAAAGGRGGIADGPGGFAAGGYRAIGASAGRPFGFNPYGAYHSGWVHGYWNGHDDAAWGWRGAGWGIGAAAGLGWGLNNWGYGSLLYGMGYLPYENPYVDPAVAAGPYDYSQPIDTTAAPAEGDATSQAVSTFDAARASFLQGDYAGALSQAETTLAQTPDDTAPHQFRALCFFALGRYDEAAAALYAVLSVGPGWDWSTLIGLYPDVATYTGQLRALEAACQADPQAAADRFVLAYHYLTQGHTDSAVGLLKQVVALKPDDSLSAKLLAQLSPQGTAPDPSSPAPADSAATDSAPADPAPADSTPPQGATIAGTWTASPSPGTTISLTIGPDGAFTWIASTGGKSSQFTGKSTFGDGLLTLAQDDGPVLVGRVGWADADHMTFTISGGSPSAPGLSFSR